jgi:iron complex transport system permease protein
VVSSNSTMQPDASRPPRPLWLLVLSALLVLAFLVHVGAGSTAVVLPWQAIAEILSGPSAQPTLANNIVWNIRLPRACEAALVGAILGLVGSAFQAQLRNPLADPYIVGVSSGAAVGGVLAMVLGFGGGIAMSFTGFFTGLLSLALVYSLARRRGLVDVTTLLLAGVAVGSLLSALTSLILLAAGHDTNRVLRWLLGNLSNAEWRQNALLLGFLIPGAVLLIRQSRRLNAFAIGEDTAARLGVDVPRLRALVLITGTAMTAAAVGSVGIIGFLGLVAPHIARRLLGVDWRVSMPAAGIMGALLLLLADLFAQRGMSAITGIAGMELPVGIVTAIIGAPSLLILLRRTG